MAPIGLDEKNGILKESLGGLSDLLATLKKESADFGVPAGETAVLEESPIADQKEEIEAKDLVQEEKTDSTIHEQLLTSESEKPEGDLESLKIDIQELSAVLGKIGQLEQDRFALEEDLSMQVGNNTLDKRRLAGELASIREDIRAERFTLHENFKKINELVESLTYNLDSAGAKEMFDYIAHHAPEMMRETLLNHRIRRRAKQMIERAYKNNKTKVGDSETLDDIVAEGPALSAEPEIKQDITTVLEEEPVLSDVSAETLEQSKTPEVSESLGQAAASDNSETLSEVPDQITPNQTEDVILEVQDLKATENQLETPGQKQNPDQSETPEHTEIPVPNPPDVPEIETVDNTDSAEIEPETESTPTDDGLVINQIINPEQPAEELVQNFEEVPKPSDRIGESAVSVETSPTPSEIDGAKSEVSDVESDGGVVPENDVFANKIASVPRAEFISNQLEQNPNLQSSEAPRPAQQIETLEEQPETVQVTEFLPQETVQQTGDRVQESVQSPKSRQGIIAAVRGFLGLKEDPQASDAYLLSQEMMPGEETEK